MTAEVGRHLKRRGAIARDLRAGYRLMDAEMAISQISPAVRPAERLVRADTLVVIPAFCEANNIARVVAEVRQAAPSADILVVDDGSTDATREVARAAGAYVVTHPINLGYGNALQTGFKYALKHDYDFVVQIDGDGQHDPAYIPALLAPLLAGTCDLVLGSRFLGVTSYHVPLARRIGQSLFGFIASKTMHQRITDPTTGYQALNRRVFGLLASDVYPADYPDADVLIMLHRSGLRLTESGVRMFENPDNRSMHSGLKPLYYIFKMLLSISVTLLRQPPKVDPV